MDKGKIEKLNKSIEDIIRKRLYQKYPYGVKYKGSGPKVASSTLARSISSSFDPATLEFGIEMESYGKYVDEGRKPGKGVPIEPLTKWIKEKGIKGRDKEGRFITHESLAFLISRGIKKYGIKETNFIELSLQDIYNSVEINDLIEEIIAEDLETE